MIKGAHNSLTGYPLKGWQRLFTWFIQPWCRCQNRYIMKQLDNGINLFDIQIAHIKDKDTKEMFYTGSHGIAWYIIDSYFVLKELNEYSKTTKEKIYIILGLDKHFNYTTDKMRSDFREFVKEFNKHFPNLILVRAFIEDPWEIIYEDHSITDNMIERYWSLNWAKAMKKHWWQFYYYLPCPRLWKWIYGKQWDKEAEESGKEIYITDFV